MFTMISDGGRGGLFDLESCLTAVSGIAIESLDFGIRMRFQVTSNTSCIESFELVKRHDVSCHGMKTKLETRDRQQDGEIGLTAQNFPIST